MSEIKGKGIPTRQTAGALGDIYIDTNTGVRYKCTGAYGITTHIDSTKEFEWKPIRSIKQSMANPQVQTRQVEEKPHETPKKPIKQKAKPVEKLEKATEEQEADKANTVKEEIKETKSNAPHNYAKHFDEERKAE